MNNDQQPDLFEDTDWHPLPLQGFDPVRATARLQKYWDTYHEQHGYENYKLETFLEDALYGVGMAVDDKYRFANGFDRFKEFLQKRWFKRQLKGQSL